VADLVIRQVRSSNGASPRQRETLRSLRLGRIGRTSRRPDGPELRGRLRVVDHLIEIEGEPTASGPGKAPDGEA